MKLSDLYPHLLHQFASEADLVRAIEDISRAFTTDRHNIQRYLSDPRLVSAYTVFYLTTNVPKLAAVFDWLTPAEREAVTRMELVDVGAGPGTFTLAWKVLTGADAVMLETAPLMREQAAKLVLGLFGAPAQFRLSSKHKPRLLLFGHSLNEMGVAAGLSYVKDADPDRIWLIEPGTKETFKIALEFRQALLQSGWGITFPCLGASACPMQGTENWCHQYVDVRHDAQTERLTQLVHKDRRRLPLTVMMFERPARVIESANRARIVRVKEETKFSHEWQVCHSADRQLTLSEFQLPKKSYPKEEKRAIEALLSGSLIEYQVEKVTAQSTRIRLVR